MKNLELNSVSGRKEIIFSVIIQGLLMNSIISFFIGVNFMHYFECILFEKISTPFWTCNVDDTLIDIYF